LLIIHKFALTCFNVWSFILVGPFNMRTSADLALASADTQQFVLLFPRHPWTELKKTFVINHL
jgi:hypothetical protein